MKNAIIEMKNILGEINIRINKAEKWISELERRQIDGNYCCRIEERKKNEKNEDSLRGIWNIKCTNICTVGVPGGVEKKGIEEYLKR